MFGENGTNLSKKKDFWIEFSQVGETVATDLQLRNYSMEAKEKCSIWMRQNTA